MRKECICCRRPMVPTMIDMGDQCAACARDTSEFLDKFNRGESVEDNAHHIVAGLLFGAFCLMLGAGLTWMVKLL